MTVCMDLGNNQLGQSVWLCRCDCGVEKTVCITALRGGYTKSCGCLRKDSWKKRPAKNIKNGKFTCSRCGKRKLLKEKARGRCYRCVECNREYHRERYRSNSVGIRAAQEKYRERNADRINKRAAELKREKPEKYLCQLAKGRAKRLGVPFSLTPADIHIPDLCPVLGVRLSFAKHIPGKRGGPSSETPTIDRMNPRKGYVPGNVEVISWRANSLKKDGTLEEFELLVRWMKKRK